MRPFAIAKHFKSLQSLARSITAVCLITFLAASASCLHVTAHPQAMCNHCTHNRPMNQQTPPCCSVSHHPPAVFTSTEFHQPAQSALFIMPLRALASQAFASLATPFIEAPPHPPRLTLRI